MASIVKISEASCIALQSMAYMAKTFPHLSSTHTIAAKIEVSEAHLSKVLQQLTKVGLALSIRGPAGGFRLAKEPKEINLIEIIETIEGKLTWNSSIKEQNTNDKSKCIMFGDLLEEVNDKIKNYLLNTSLLEITERYNHLYE